MVVFYWIISTFVWLLAWLPLYLLGFFVTWAGLLLCDARAEHMPWPWWFWDNSHGINGTLHGNNARWPILCKGKERTFNNRWTWVTWRNPVSNLSLYILGIKSPPQFDRREWHFGPITIERCISKGPAWLRSYTVYWRWSETQYAQHSFGWKVADTVTSENRARFIYRISPCRTKSAAGTNGK